VTAFVSWLEDDFVAVGMDTLNVFKNDDGSRSPANFTTKIFPLPHLKALMCGMGDARIIAAWHSWIIQILIARDIFTLDQAAPDQLPEITARYESPCRTSIIHFGYDDERKRYCGFKYSSEQGYRSEEMERTIYVSPTCDGLINDFLDEEFKRYAGGEYGQGGDALARLFAAIIGVTKVWQEKQPAIEKVNIGGEVHFLSLTPQGYNMWVCHTFDDYEKVWLDMLSHAGFVYFRPVSAGDDQLAAEAAPAHQATPQEA
jgi:hypothetical protein